MFQKFRHPDLGLLILRLGLAFIFIEHGLTKFTATQGYIRLFSHLGLPYPLCWVYFVGAVEVLGGIAMLVGYWTEIFGAMLTIDMLVVIVKVRMGPQANTLLGGHEFELMLLLMSLGIALIGPGRYALQQPKDKQILV